MNNENKKELTQEEKQKIIKEYEQKMKMFRTEIKKMEMNERRELIETLTESELELIVNLYKPQIMALCKKHNQNCEMEK